MLERTECEACGADVFPDRPHWGWKLANVAAWTASLAIGPWCALLVPLNVVLAPMFLFGAMSAITFTAERAYGDSHCPACGKVIVAQRARARRAARALQSSTA
jgi:hypothetical protein